MVSSGMSIVKYALFGFNLIFVIISIILMTSGGILLSNINDSRIHDVIEGVPRGSAILLVIIGVAIFLVAFLGCCGAIRESYCMLLTFSTIIFLLFIMELVSAGIIYAFRNDLEKEVKKGFKIVIKNYEARNSSSSAYEAVDDLQKNLKCCGGTNYTDWEANPLFNNTFPQSCCPDTDLKETCGTDKVYTTSCYTAIGASLKGTAYTLATAAIVVAVTQFLGMLFSCCLARTIKREYEVV